MGRGKTKRVETSGTVFDSCPRWIAVGILPTKLCWVEWEWGGRSRFYNSGNTGKRIQKQGEVVGGKGKEFKQNCSGENKNNFRLKGL